MHKTIVYGSGVGVARGADMPLSFFLRRGLVQVENSECYKPILRILN